MLLGFDKAPWIVHVCLLTYAPVRCPIAIRRLFSGDMGETTDLSRIDRPIAIALRHFRRLPDVE